MKAMKLTLFVRLWPVLAIILEVGGLYEDTRRLRTNVNVKKRNIQMPKMPEAKNPFKPIKEKSERRVMDAINKFRAEVCYRMKVEHGVEFGTFENCEKFMVKACDPGKDRLMDGDHHEVTTGEGYCKEFFPEAEKKAKEQIEKEDRETEEAAPAPATPMGIIAPAPAVATPAAIAEPKISPAPAPQALPASPAAAPMRASPFTPGISKGKPNGKLGDDEAYYYKKGGKDPVRLHMDENLKLPTQGYWGKLVSHDDMESATEDWGVEFGSHSGQGTYESHCRKHCDSEWCIKWGYCDNTNHKSGVEASAKLFVSIFVVLISTLMCL